MRIIETPVFTKRITDVLADDEYRELQWTLLINPEAGKLIPGANGLRKLRWGVSGRGKRGGLRIIYYVYLDDEIIYMLLPYKKSDQEDLTRTQLKILSAYVREGVL